MTLREYLVAHSRDTVKLFAEDYEAAYAQAWDADVFCLKYFKREARYVNPEDVFGVYRIIIETIRPVTFDELSNINNYKEDRIDLGDGSYKKLNLEYNPNTYDLENPDE